MQFSPPIFELDKYVEAIYLLTDIFEISRQVTD